MTNDHDPFYVGYHAVAPSGIARGLRVIALLLATLGLGYGVTLARSMNPEAAAAFEYGHPSTIRGQVREFPYPVLLVPSAGLTDREAAYDRYWLVAPGKHGAQALTRGLDGEWVEATGFRIGRAEGEMLEVRGLTVAPPDPKQSRPLAEAPTAALGRMTLTGEILDSKCWLGVMRPGAGNVHRGCAARCLSGGMPPLLQVHDSSGRTVQLLLTDAEGRPAHQRFAQMAGRSVQLTGEVTREGDLLVMRVEEVED